jgi:hypothetical protein
MLKLENLRTFFVEVTRRRFFVLVFQYRSTVERFFANAISNRVGR